MSAHDDAVETQAPSNHDLNVAAGAVLVAVNAGIGVVRLALLPARILARGPLVAPFVHNSSTASPTVGDDAGARVRERLEAVPERVVEQVVADLDAGEIAGIAIDGEAAERIARQVLASPALERILMSPRASGWSSRSQPARRFARRSRSSPPAFSARRSTRSAPLPGRADDAARPLGRPKAITPASPRGRWLSGSTPRWRMPSTWSASAASRSLPRWRAA